MSQLKKGAILNYVTIALTNVGGLILTPFIIRKLGDAEYGVYMAIGALVATISILDFGLNNTIVRFVAKYRAENDKKAEENFLATTLLIYFVISILVVFFGWLFYHQIDGYFTKMTSDELLVAKQLFIVLICNLAIKLPGGSFTGICLGYEQFVFPKAINIIRYVLRAGLVIAILYLGGKAVALVILDTILNVIIILATMFFAFKKLRVTFKLHELKGDYLKEIFQYSIWVFVYSLVSQFQWRAGHIVLGYFSQPEILAVYAVGLMLGGYYGAFASAVTSVFLPRATQMTLAKASPEALTDMMTKIGRVSFLILLYIFGAFVLYGKQFIILWVGKSFLPAWWIALLIMIAYTIPLAQGFTGAIIEAQNKVAFKSITYLVFLAFGTFLGYFLAQDYAALGMITGSVIGWGIAQNIMNVYYYKVLKLNLFKFFKALFFRILAIALLVIVIGYGIDAIPGENWFNFIIKCGLYSVVFGVLMFRWGMNSYEKQLCTGLLGKVLRK